jgi:dihydrolipoamide dehydrogenase
MKTIERDLVVLGGGPGGYTAAFRAADLGRSVTLVEQEPVLGGVCLNVGCIPSKTLLHYSEVIEETEKIAELGLAFSSPTIDLERIRAHKAQVVKGLNDGIAGLAKARKVEVIHGIGTLKSAHELLVGDDTVITFKDLIIATGSRPARIPGIPYDDERVWDSTDALELKEIPKRLAIIGAGIIGLEMASIYHALGSEITIIEMLDSIIPPADKDLKAPLLKAIKGKYQLYLSTKVEEVSPSENELTLKLDSGETVACDALLVAVGRRPNSDSLNLESAGVAVDGRGFITVDEQLRSSVDQIYAIGDVTGDPMLAHRASAQAKVAAEAAAGEKSAFSPLGIPSVAYTQPEIAWVGLTEKEATERGIEYTKGTFPWQASSRAMSALAALGVTKALFEAKSGRLIGAGICGKNAGELIAEALIALEMGAVNEDIALSIHAHPTLSETFAIAAELTLKRATDMLNR